MLKKLVSVVLSIVVLMSIGVSVVGAEELSFRVEGESCIDTNTGFGFDFNSSLSGNSAISIYTYTAPIDGDYYFGYKVNAPVSGIYQLDYVATKQGKLKDIGTSGTEWYSAHKIQINGEEAVGFEENSTFLTGQDVVIANDGINYDSFRLYVFLKQGSNDIKFLIQERYAGGMYISRLDYMQFTLKEKSLDCRTVRIEGEQPNFSNVAPSYSWDGEYSNGIARLWQASTTDYPDGLTAKYYVWAPTAGAYRVETGSIYLNQGWSSDFAIKVNGTQNITAENAICYAGYGTSGQYGKHIFATRAMLNQGLNVIDISVTENRGDNTYVTFIDYIDFIKEDRVNLYSVEAESAPGGFNLDGRTDFSGGNAIGIWTSNEGDYSATYTVNILTTGYYELYMNMSGPTINGNFSPVKFKFDNNEYETIGIETNNVTHLGTINDNLPADQFGVFLYNNLVYLEKGLHTFSIKVDEYAPWQNPPLYGFVFDKFDLKLVQNECAALEAQLDKALLDIGDTANIKVYPVYESGDLLYDDTYMVTFSSSDERVVAVDGNGVVTANNYGKAKIQVCVITNDTNVSKTAEFDVYVTDTFGVRNIESTKTETTVDVNVNLVGYTANTGNEILILASYSTSDNGVNSLNKIAVKNVGVLASGIDNNIQISLDGVETGDKVVLYVWDSIDTLKPLWINTSIN